MRIVVIGGTGLVGSKVVRGLTEHGHDAVAASPSSGVNTFTGEGLSEVLAGADVVVDVSNSPSFDGDASKEFFRTATTNLLRAEAEAGVSHHVALSVVGTDYLARQSGYFQAKLAQEEIISSGRIPYTIVHATQFFEFLRAIAQSGTEGNTVRLPHSLFRPMAAEDVATAVAEAALAPPLNGTMETAGPEPFHIDELVGKVLAYDKDPRKVVVDSEALYFGIKLTDKSLVPGATARIASTRFEWWLTHVPAPPQRAAA